MTNRWTPHATVATIIKVDERFLMIEEYAHGDTPVINQPAGHIEEGETIVEAAKRETLEESGWHVDPIGLVGFYVFKAPNNVTYHRYCLFADAVSEVPNAKLDTGIIAAHWLTLAEIEASTQLRSPLVLTSIKDYLAGKRYPLDLITELL